jgi:5-methylcytosine-specific restriction endonuclease McrA
MTMDRSGPRVTRSSSRTAYRCQGCGTVEMGDDGTTCITRCRFARSSPARNGEKSAGRPRPWQVANRLENLVTLCQSCHHRAESGVELVLVSVARTDRRSRRCF